jgi:hypothetical protein
MHEAVDIVIPILILIAVCAVAALGYRALTASARGSGEANSGDPVPRNPPPDDERPLGDTPEAHDEVTAHDLPLDNPGRHEVEDEAGGADRTTRGTTGDSVAH